MRSASCAGSMRLSASRPSRARISARQSGIAGSRDVRDGLYELPPTQSLCFESLSPVASDRVIATAPLPGLLDPPADDPPALFHAVEQRIQRGDVEREHAARLGLNELRDLVAVSRLGLEQRENQELGAALFELGSQHERICVRHTYGTYTCSKVKRPHVRAQPGGELLFGHTAGGEAEDGTGSVEIGNGEVVAVHAEEGVRRHEARALVAIEKGMRGFDDREC